MDFLTDGALEEGGGTGLQHLVQTLTAEVQWDEKSLAKEVWKNTCGSDGDRG